MAFFNMTVYDVSSYSWYRSMSDTTITAFLSCLYKIPAVRTGVLNAALGLFNIGDRSK